VAATRTCHVGKYPAGRTRPCAPSTGKHVADEQEGLHVRRRSPRGPSCLRPGCCTRRGQPKSRRNSGHANAPSAPTSDVSGSSSSMLGVAQWPSTLSATYWRFVVGDGQLGRRMEYQVNVTALEAAAPAGRRYPAVGDRPNTHALQCSTCDRSPLHSSGVERVRPRGAQGQRSARLHKHGFASARRRARQHDSRA
jgi:hypothetical protein